MCTLKMTDKLLCARLSYLCIMPLVLCCSTCPGVLLPSGQRPHCYVFANAQSTFLQLTPSSASLCCHARLVSGTLAWLPAASYLCTVPPRLGTWLSVTLLWYSWGTSSAASIWRSSIARPTVTNSHFWTSCLLHIRTHIIERSSS